MSVREEGGYRVVSKIKSKPTLRRKYDVDEGEDIESVEDALKVAFDLRAKSSEFAVFRGQGNWGWILRPKVFRSRKWYSHEREMVRELVAAQPQEFSTDRLMLDRLVRMQHYGLPTRLLDVTTNFLSALFFSCRDDTMSSKDGAVFIIKGKRLELKYYDSDTVSLVANLSNLSLDEKGRIYGESPENSGTIIDDGFNTFEPVERLLQFVREEKPYFIAKAKKTDLNGVLCVMPKKNNRRIVAQSGAFLIFGLVGTDRNPDLGTFIITRHKVPLECKEDILTQLDALGVTELSLYPELDHAATYIREHFG
jgi:FRG domain